MEPNYVLDEVATANKILRGEMPDGNWGNDTVTVITDNVARIYLNLLSKIVLGTLGDGTPEEIVEKRISLFDDIATVINLNRYGRLYKLIDEVKAVLAKYKDQIGMWPNTKMQNNVSTYIVDFWIWDEHERQDLLVIVDYNEIAANLQDQIKPASTSEGESIAESAE